MFLPRNVGTFFLLIVLSFVLVSWCAEETPDSGECAYAEARCRLSSGDFEGGVKSLHVALRYDSLSAKYNNELRSVQGIVKLREEFAQERDSLRWNILARQLRVYYQKNGIWGEMVDICLQIFDRSKLTWDAVCVVEAMILAERFDEALDFTALIDAKGTNPSIQIARGYVLCAANRNLEARKLVRSISMDGLNTSDDLFRLARLQAETGLCASSVKTLTRCFELTPLGQLPELKKFVVQLAEFEPLLTSSEFAAALTTQSKLASIDRSCSLKWVGTVSDQRPKYIRDLSKGPINPDDWKIK